MLDFNQFEEKIKTINSNLRNKYKKYFSISNEEFLKSLEENVGEIENFEKLGISDPNDDYCKILLKERNNKDWKFEVLTSLN